MPAIRSLTDGVLHAVRKCVYLWFPVLVQSTFVTDTDRVSVIAFCMSTDSAQWTGVYHFSGLSDIVVVTDSVESSFSVRGFQCFQCERMVLFRGTAMDDY